MPVPTDQTDTEPGTQQAGIAMFLPGPARPERKNRDLRRHRLTRRISVAAPIVIYLSLPVIAYQLTGSSVWTALAVAVAFLPHLTTPLMMRIIPTRFDRRHLLIAIDAANAAVLASVSIAFSVDALTAPHLLVAAFAAQTLFVYHDAAYAAVAPYSPGRERPGMPLFSGSSGALVATIIASGVLGLTAMAPLLTVDGVSLVASALLVRALAVPSETLIAPRVPRPRGDAGPRRRLSVLLRRRTDLVYATVCGLHAAAAGAFMGQFTPWLNEDLGVRPIRDVRLGLLLVLWAGGAWLAPAVLPRVARRLATHGVLAQSAADRLVTTGVLAQTAADRLVFAATGTPGPEAPGASGAGACIRKVFRHLSGSLGGYRATLVFLPLSALLLFGVAFAPHWIVAAVPLALWGIAYMVVVVDARVAQSGLRMLALGLGWPAGALLAGVIAQGAGPRMGIATGGLCAVVATAVAWSSRLRTAARTVLITDIDGMPATAARPASEDACVTPL